MLVACAIFSQYQIAGSAGLQTYCKGFVSGLNVYDAAPAVRTTAV
jgi:hypothetical protein